MSEEKIDLEFLEEVILISLYGNWLIEFIGNLTFPYASRQLIDLILPLVEGFGVFFLIITLAIYFLQRKQRSLRLWFLHNILMGLVIVIDVRMTPNEFGLQIGTFYFVGLLLWALIHWVDSIRQRLGIKT